MKTFSRKGKEREMEERERGIIGVERKLPVQSRVDVVKLAEIGELLRKSGFVARSMSELVSCCVDFLWESLGEEFEEEGVREESLESAWQWLRERGYVQRALEKRGQKKRGMSMAFENIRKKGGRIDKRQYNRMHNRGSVREFVREGERDISKEEVDRLISQSKGEKEEEIEKEVMEVLKEESDRRVLEMIREVDEQVERGEIGKEEAGLKKNELAMNIKTQLQGRHVRAKAVERYKRGEDIIEIEADQSEESVVLKEGELDSLSDKEFEERLKDRDEKVLKEEKRQMDSFLDKLRKEDNV